MARATSVISQILVEIEPRTLVREDIDWGFTFFFLSFLFAITMPVA